jgi:replicative DNA helicase
MKMPYVERAEEAVVGAIVLNPSLAEHVIGLLRSEHFFAPEYRRAYEAIVNACSSGSLPDYVTLSDASDGKLDDTLIRATGAVFTEESFDYHVSKIIEAARRRNLILAAEKISSSARDMDRPIDEVIADGISDLDREYGNSIETIDFVSVMNEVVEECEKPMDVPIGLPTGLDALDEKLSHGGLVRGHLTIVGGATGQGKSVLAAQIARSVGLRGFNVLYFTLEDSAKSVVGRCLSAATSGQIENSRIQARSIPSEKIFYWQETKDKLRKIGSNITFVDDASKSVEELCIIARRQNQKRMIDLLVWDYLQETATSGFFNRDQQRVDHILRQIISLRARLTNTAILLISQLRRQDGVPKLSDLYHSGKLEQSAHTVILIWNPDVGDYHRARTLLISKQKNGARDMTAVAGWNGECARYFNLPRCEIESYLDAIEKEKNREWRKRRDD